MKENPNVVAIKLAYPYKLNVIISLKNLNMKSRMVARKFFFEFSIKVGKQATVTGYLKFMLIRIFSQIALCKEILQNLIFNNS